jgi:hypothetical protein
MLDWQQEKNADNFSVNEVKNESIVQTYANVRGVCHIINSWEKMH